MEEKIVSGMEIIVIRMAILLKFYANYVNI